MLRRRVFCVVNADDVTPGLTYIWEQNRGVSFPKLGVAVPENLPILLFVIDSCNLSSLFFNLYKKLFVF